MRSFKFVAVICAAAGLAGLAIGAPRAAEKEPPSCSAIAFRPVPPGQSDGEVDAGLYKSRFGRIEVKAVVKSGSAETYYVEINGKRPTAVAGKDLPKAIAACAKMKRLSLPSSPAEPCLGDRLTVLIAHSGDQRYLLLYGHNGGKAEFCSAGTA